MHPITNIHYVYTPPYLRDYIRQLSLSWNCGLSVLRLFYFEADGLSLFLGDSRRCTDRNVRNSAPSRYRTLVLDMNKKIKHNFLLFFVFSLLFASNFNERIRMWKSFAKIKSHKRFICEHPQPQPIPLQLNFAWIYLQDPFTHSKNASFDHNIKII